MRVCQSGSSAIAKLLRVRCSRHAAPTPPASGAPRRAAGGASALRPSASAGTPEQIAKKAVAKRPTVPGRPDRVEVTFRFTLARALMERLTARAIREGRSVESVVAEILEAEAE